MKVVYAFLAVFSLTLGVVQGAEAAKRASKSPQLVRDVSELSNVSIQVQSGKKTKSYQVSCYLGAAGLIREKRKKSKLFFILLKDSNLIRGKRPTLKRKILKQANSTCKQLKGKCPEFAPISFPSETFPAREDYLSLKPFTGTFGEREAEVLFNRFGFGATTDRVERAVQIGLDATINELTTYVFEPEVESIAQDLQCDGYFSSSRYNRQCDPNKPNEVSIYGVSGAWLYRMIASQNSYFERLAFFLHDERMAAAPDKLFGCAVYAYPKHFDMLHAVARSGDYPEFLKKWTLDTVGHLTWLDGAQNIGTNPNQNFAREFLELGTVGSKDLNGNPVYGDADIVAASKAFSGWRLNLTTNNDVACEPVFEARSHASGRKTLFQGTAYQACVENGSDMVEATLRHPRLAESLAQDIWLEFINNDPSKEALRELAQLIRKEGYQLHPVMRTIMRSQALYAPGSENTLIKHPLELVVGLSKQANLPLNDRGNLSPQTYLYTLGESPGFPPTVFGWNTTNLSSPGYQLAWRDSLTYQYYYRSDLLVPSLEQRYLAPVALVGGTSAEVVHLMSRSFGFSLTEAQIRSLLPVIDSRVICTWDPQIGDCVYSREQDSIFDGGNDEGRQYERRLRLSQLAMFMLSLPSYRVK